MFRRLVVLLTVALSVLATAAAPALAGSKYMSKTTGVGAQTWWTQVDGTDPGSAFGNVHVGWLYAYETSNGLGDAFVYIDDWDCPPGQLPTDGGHGDPEPTGCTWIGSRQGEGYGLSFQVDRKLENAHLSGQLTLFGGGHGGGGVVGRPTADITWTGTGALRKSSSTWRYNDGTTTYSERYSSSDRSAVMSGSLGSMGFDPDLSGGSISSFRSTTKSQTR